MTDILDSPPEKQLPLCAECKKKLFRVLLNQFLFSMSQDQFIAEIESMLVTYIQKAVADSKDKNCSDSLDQAADPQQNFRVVRGLRTGTHDASARTDGMARFAAAEKSANRFEWLEGPAVWRHGSATETVRALEKNGMDTYDIPAFLRRQPD